MFCPQCGKAVAITDAKFCCACGSRFPKCDASSAEAPVKDASACIEEGHEQTVQPSGMKGWLLVLVGVLMIVVPLVGIGSFLSHLAILKNLSPSMVGRFGWEEYLFWMWLAVGTNACLSIYASLRLLNGKGPDDVEAVRTILWVIGPVSAIIINGLIPYLIHETQYMRYVGLTDSSLVASIIGSSLFSLVWVLYLSRSRRVRNTYG